MSLILPSTYSNATPVSGSYPQGSFKNESVSGLLDGTPFEKEWPNDIFGFLQSFVKEAQITPSGVADTVLASDYYDGFKHVIAQGYSNIKDYDPLGLTGQALTVGSDGIVYKAKIANGPSSSVVDPVGDLTGTWRDTTGIGVDQAWLNVTGSRVGGVTYTNNTGRPIVVVISVSSLFGSAAMYVNGQAIANIVNNDTTNAVIIPVTVIVPDQQTYKIDLVTAGATISLWQELR